MNVFFYQRKSGMNSVLKPTQPCKSISKHHELWCKMKRRRQ